MFHPYETARARLLASCQYMLLQDISAEERVVLQGVIDRFTRSERRVEVTPQRAPVTKSRRK